MIYEQTTTFYHFQKHEDQVEKRERERQAIINNKRVRKA
jgi:hypothetical protein